MMKVYQLNENNVGILDHNYPGYQHGDALTKEGHVAHEAIKHDMSLFAEDLIKMYPDAKKFLDVGSGAGYISERIRELGNEYLSVTIDGNVETRELPSINNDYHFVVKTDDDYSLVDENKNIILFDIITCFEHFEHIHPNKFDVFIEMIKRHMYKDSVLYASAANWKYDQNNDNVHVNVKTELEWEQEMIKHGFEKINKKLFNEINTSACAGRWSGTAELSYKLKNK
jgi:cyclopropane fatty-acyl-phospholipid synthase-like methyltransferase